MTIRVHAAGRGLLALAFLTLWTGATRAQLAAPGRSGQVTVLRSPDLDANAAFGRSVSLAGDRALVGAMHSDGAGQDSGAAYLFDASSGALVAALADGAAGFNDQLGASVALSEQLAVVGAPNMEGGGAAPGSGVVFVYDARSGAVRERLAPPRPVFQGGFGRSVAVEGTTLLVGEPGAEPSGAAHLIDGLTGELLVSYEPPPGCAVTCDFGARVGLSGPHVLVTDSNVNSFQSARVHVFDRLSGAPLAQLQPDWDTGQSGFGWSIDLRDGLALVGAPEDRTAGQGAGAAYLFDAASGALLAKWLPAVGVPGAGFGWSVALGSGRAAIGSFPGVAPALTGAVHLFQLSSAVEQAVLTSPLEGGGSFGTSLDWDGARLLVGDEGGLADGPLIESAVVFAPLAGVAAGGRR